MTEAKEDFLGLAKQVESCMEELYDLFARNIPEDKEFWEKMSLEERIHAKLLDKFAQEYKQNLSKSAPDKSIFLRVINNINKDIQGYKGKKITRKEAFEKAAQFEKMVLEVHFSEFFSSLKPEDNADILKMIQEQDKQHLEKLRQKIGK